MAIWRSSLRQTAANDAASIVVAELTAGILEDQSGVDARFSELVESIFADLDEVAKQDDAAYEDSGTARTSKRASKTGARKGSGGKGKGGLKFSLEQALNMTMNSGVFEGETLGDILDIDVASAESDYDYGDGERDGSDYVAWLASDKNKNDYTRAAARVVADAEGLSL